MHSERAARFPWAYVAGTLLLVALAAWILARSIGSVPHEPGSDDGYYLEYASAVSGQGLGTFPRLFATWNANEPSWIYPSPLRVFYVLVSAGWVGIFGQTLLALSWLSVAAHLAWIAITAVFARRHWCAPQAFLLTALASFAPLLLGTARQALQDSFLLVFLALAIWTFLEVLERPHSRGWRIAFVTSLALAILSKELAVLLVPAFALVIAYERWVLRRALPLGGLALLLALPGLLCTPVFLAAAGGLAPLLRTAGIVLGSPATNTYAIKFGSGPWYRYLIDFLCLSPGVTLLALGFAGALILRRGGGLEERVPAALGLIAAVLLFEMSFFTKNARYLMVLELPLTVFALAFLARLVPEGVPRRWGLIGAAVLGLCWLDWRTFEYGWVQHGIYDPLSGVLFQLRDLMPRPGR